ncbi:MAG: hypothetical protein K6360_00500 [Deltaproteobacteria bacterium]
MAGKTWSFGAGGYDFWVIKLDANGNVAWQKTYGGTNTDEAWSIQQTTDGGYIVAGGTGSFGAGGDLWVIKLDASGNVAWQKTYGGPRYEYATSIQQTSDGGYIVAGLTYSFGTGDADFWVLKLDASGNVTWQKTYGGPRYEYATSIQQTSDGGYIVAGGTGSFGAGSDFWVIKLDANGEIPGCGLMGTSNATVQDTNVTGGVTTISGVDSSATVNTPNPTVTDTNVHPAQHCPYGGKNLVVTKAGTGSGTVTSNDGGINCGSDCTETYSSGTQVTLTATPDTGSTFAGWGGDCSGTGDATVIMDADKSCTAMFSSNQGISSLYNTIQKIYIAYYQRPADPKGLSYWAQKTDEAGGDLTQIINAFANSQEAQELYGTIDSNTIGNVIDSIYLALFGRQPDAEGKQFYINGFNNGTFTAGTITLNILDGAQNEDAQAIQDKLYAANLFTMVIAGVDSMDEINPATVPQATYQGTQDANNARAWLAKIPNQITNVTYDDVVREVQQNIADPGDPILQYR